MQQYRKNLGKVSLTAEGAWNLNNSYDILSIVYDEHTQHGFISRKAVPQGVDLYNKEYWMPLNVSGYADNNVIILSKKTSEASIQSYTLEEAIASIKSVGRRPGAILGFYNENNDRLDIGGRWELWQFNDTNVYNWENVDSWQNLYYNYNKFMGWFKDENFLIKYAPFPEIGCYAFVGSEFNEATVYRCDNKYVWNNTTQHAWDYVKVIVDGNVTVGENGNWFNNGEDTGIPASVKGENGKTPVFREKDNTIQYSFDNVNWITISDKVAAWFRWNATTGDTQANNVGRIQISRDNVTWTNLSGDIINNLHISRYIGADEALPTSGIAEGTIYAKGPIYADGDTSHANPIYRLWVYAWKDNTLAWQDNGEFISIAAGVVQETGDSETEVMSQKAVTEKLSDLGLSFFIGSEDADVYSNIKLIPGNTYRLVLKTTDWIHIGSSSTSYLFRIYSVNSDGETKDLAKEYTYSAKVEKFYDIHIPLDSVGIYVGGRAISEYKVYFNFYDISIEQYRKVKEQALATDTPISSDVLFIDTNINKGDKFYLKIDDLTRESDSYVQLFIKNYDNSSYNDSLYIGTRKEFIAQTDIYRIGFAIPKQSTPQQGDSLKIEVGLVETLDGRISLNEQSVKDIDKKVEGYNTKLSKDIDDLNVKMPIIQTSFEGNNNTFVDGENIVGILKDHIYRVYVGNPDVDMSGDTFTTNHYRYGIYGYKDGVETFLNGAVYPSVKVLNNHYDFIAYENYDYIRISGRCTKGHILISYIEDITNTYYDANFVNKVNQVSTKDSNADSGVLSIAFFSDIHYDLSNLKQYISFCNTFNSKIDVLLCGGDFVSHFWSTINYTLEKWVNTEGAKNIMLTIGNHDVWETDYYDVVDKTIVYERVFVPLVESWNVIQPDSAQEEGKMYYYKDYTDKKVRLVVLDCMNWDDNQKTWFESVLSSALADSLTVVAASHYAPGVLVPFDCSFSSLKDSSWTETLNEEAAIAVDNYMNMGGKFACWLCGHIHRDYLSVIQNHENQICVNITCNTSDSLQTRSCDSARIKDTISQYAIDLIGIDPYNNLIRIARFGDNLDYWMRERNSISINYMNKKIIQYC